MKAYRTWIAVARATRILEVLCLVIVLLAARGARADVRRVHDAKAKSTAPTPTPMTHAPPLPDETADAPAPEPHVPEPVGPTTMKVGLSLEKLAKFELGPGTYFAEAVLTFHCDAEPCNPDFDVTNGKITGKEKLVDERLEKAFRVKAELEADVDLSEFPFDKHVLYVGLVERGNPLSVKYVADEKTSAIDPTVKLAGWEIAHDLAGAIQKHTIDGHQIDELQFGVGIGRPRVAAVFKTLVPVFFMIFVAGFTLLLKPKSASGRLSAATAGLMTVVMFHLSSSSSLPPLGYLTRMDKFMIATYLVYLVNIALSVAIVRLDERKNEQLAQLAYLAAGGLVPGVALIAWLTVFLKIA